MGRRIEHKDESIICRRRTEAICNPPLRPIFSRAHPSFAPVAMVMTRPARRNQPENCVRHLPLCNGYPKNNQSLLRGRIHLLFYGFLSLSFGLVIGKRKTISRRLVIGTKGKKQVWVVCVREDNRPVLSFHPKKKNYYYYFWDFLGSSSLFCRFLFRAASVIHRRGRKYWRRFFFLFFLSKAIGFLFVAHFAIEYR